MKTDKKAIYGSLQKNDVLLGVSLVPGPFKGMGMSGCWVCSGMARSQGRYVPGVYTQPSDMRHLGVSTIPPSRTWDTTGYGRQPGGTHPTGMLSCLSYFRFPYRRAHPGSLRENNK